MKITIVNVSLRSQINVIYQGSPAIDLGGLRRQFYTTLLKFFCREQLLFDGSEFNLRPVSYPSATISGLYTVLGNILIHSILFEERGFPYLSSAICVLVHCLWREQGCLAHLKL